MALWRKRYNERYFYTIAFVPFSDSFLFLLVLAANHSLWQACYSPHAPPSYWFREEEKIIDVINDKDGDIINGYHVCVSFLQCL